MDTLRLAPMMGYTSAPFRLLIHLLAPKVQLYSEMISVNAVIHNPQLHYFSRFDEENNTVFQLGGDHPENSAKIAKKAEQTGFNEININCGCPSNRVQNANFGACLMQQPEKVANIIQAIQKVVNIPVSVKHRLGIDKHIDYEFVHHFVNTIHQAGCRRIIVHARNAWLAGLSPRLNRKAPPLKPEFVYQLKQDFPTLNICINGEINSLDKIKHYLSQSQKYPNTSLDGVMIGRKAWDNPYLFTHAERILAYRQILPKPQEVIEHYFQLLRENYTWLNPIWNTHTLIRPLTHLFNGMNGAKNWRIAVSTPYNSLAEAEKNLNNLAKAMPPPI